jgi:hypothetical protein
MKKYYAKVGSNEFTSPIFPDFFAIGLPSNLHIFFSTNKFLE